MIAAAIADVVVFTQTALWVGNGAFLAMAYLLFASFGAGWFAARRSALAGGLSVLLGAEAAAVFQFITATPVELAGASALDLRLGGSARGLGVAVRDRRRVRGCGRWLAPESRAPARLMRTRLVAAVIATSVGLAFWWALTEPLPVPPVILLGVPAAILFCAGIIAGRLGAIASPVALLFSLLVGSIIATQLHQYFRPNTPPVSSFGPLLILQLPDLLIPLGVAVVLGGIGGLIGERLLPSVQE